MYIDIAILPMVEWVTCWPGTRLTRVQSRVGGIQSDSDYHHNGGLVSLDPKWHVKEPKDVDKRSFPSKVKLIGQKHDCPSLTLSR